MHSTIGRDGGRRHQFVALDGLRGIAALAVAIYHVPAFVGGTVMSSAYLAVDLFFCISGFVLFHAYADRLRKGMGIGAFLLRRTVRLYPLYLVSGLSALAYVLLLGEESNLQGHGLVSFVANLLLFPLPLEWSLSDDLFPLNFVAWSILLEIGASLGFAAFSAAFVDPRRTRWTMAAAAVPMLFAGLHYGQLNLGVSAGQMPGGMARALFAFCAGIAIAHVGPVRWRPSFPLLCAFTLAVLAVDVSGGARTVYDLTVAMLVCPLLVLLGAGCRTGIGESRIAILLGRSFYPVYIFQVPFAAFVAKALGAWDVHASPMLGLAFVGGLFLFALAVERHVERPLRSWLSARVFGIARRAVPAMVAPQS